ncbi:GGDEF domain-containing protein [Aliidiomarina iranensis]|uniref:GGDEF domain-containing protein n=1 Tax=Aliidiomarina iranensis TaxID=1434071 RepID=A0A432W0G1_9GAMM|nr:GGDEF domain-containing phosphodiesterase [Aliidiomarina iranensis]RUO22468.1 GGDEF domain-containing protein [Aliidiomarina iranensis]
MNNKRIVQYYFSHKRLIQRIGLVAIAVAVMLVTWLVWYTGGIKYVYSHSMYLPILAAGFIFGWPGGILVALIAGLALGPWMPIDTTTGEMQELANWLYRMGYFILIGGLSGLVNDSVKRYIDYLRWLARHDIKTKLPNRKKLLKDIRELISTDKPKRLSRERNLLIVVSIDNVRELQGAFGFRVIHQVIHVSAASLQKQIDKKLTLYRTDSNQIGILLQSAPNEIEAYLKKVMGVLKSTVRFDSYSVYVASHAGAVCISAHYDEPEIYLQHAEIALAHAYKTQRDYVQFSSSLELTVQRNITLLGDLAKALRANELTVHYQPKIDLASNSVCGAEALIRWHHPLYGDISPSDFIPQAEQSTLILEITKNVMTQVTQQIKEWREQGVSIPIAINISSHDIMDKDFVARLLNELDKADIPGEMIEVELTEGALINDLAHTQLELLRLSRAKVVISVDDFGTGYSSLQYLHRLPISVIKIDRSFVQNLPNNDGARHIVDAAIGLAKNMGIKTIAEGVETPSANAYLRKIGCNSVQGFYYTAALPADKFIAWYREFQPLSVD